MEEWKLTWEDRMRMIWINGEQTSSMPANYFLSELNKILRGLNKEKRSCEEIRAWFEVIPSVYWKNTQENKLHVAARIGNQDIVSNLISVEHIDINRKNTSSETPLLMATRANNAKVVEALLDAGAIHSNSYYQKRIGPLHVAAQNAYSSIIKLLLDAGADVNATDFDGYSPLHRLVRFQAISSEVMDNQVIISTKYLIEAGANVNSVDKDKSAPLHLAIKNQHFDFAYILLDVDANVSQTDRFSNTPLHYAVQQEGNVIDLIERMVNMGADLDIVNTTGVNPLWQSVMSNNHEVAQILMDAGASTKFSTISNYSPITDAMENKNTCMIDFLLSVKTDVKLLEQRTNVLGIKQEDNNAIGELADELLFGTYEGLTCLQAVALENNEELVIKFLNHGADVLAKSDEGHGVLYYASGAHRRRKMSSNMFKVLLELGAGAGFNEERDYKTLRNILLYVDEEILDLFMKECGIKDVSRYGSEITEHMFENILRNSAHGYKLLKIILNNGNFDMNARYKLGHNLIHRAIHHKNGRCVKTLLKRGVNIDALTEGLGTRKSALEMACWARNFSVVELLLKYNADFNIGSQLPLQILIQFSFIEPDVRRGIHCFLKYIALAEVQGREIVEGNYQMIRDKSCWQKSYEKYKQDLITMREHKIYDSISFLDVLLDAKRYSRHRYVIQAFTRRNKFRLVAGEFRDMLVERFEKVRKRQRLIELAKIGFMSVLENDFRLSIIPEFVVEFLSNKDLRNLIDI